MTHQQRRLRREFNTDNCGIMFSEKTCNDKKIKIGLYGTIQDLYDYEFMKEQEEIYED